MRQMIDKNTDTTTLRVQARENPLQNLTTMRLTEEPGIQNDIIGAADGSGPSVFLMSFSEIIFDIRNHFELLTANKSLAELVRDQNAYDQGYDIFACIAAAALGGMSLMREIDAQESLGFTSE